MNIILLSGGSGMRLWPLSTSARSKQFLKLLQDENGRPESMVQRVYRQLSNAGLETKHILMATAAAQQDAILGQLGKQVEIVAEPERRNTFPAILLSAAYLYFEKSARRTKLWLLCRWTPIRNRRILTSCVRWRRLPAARVPI